MRRWCLSGVLVLLAFVVWCRKPNRAPEFVSVRGAGSVEPGSTYTYTVIAEDPDMDSVRCAMSWGDGTPDDTGAWVGSLDTSLFEHCWSDTGRYPVHVNVWDDESAAAPTLFYGNIGCRIVWPPTLPEIDSVWGPDSGLAGLTYEFGVRATDINGDKVRYQFRWDDGWMSDWSRWRRSGTVWTRTHVWQDYGAYRVEVRCEDKTGLRTGWLRICRIFLLPEPKLKWEVSLDEPWPRVPLVNGQGQVVVVDRGLALKFNTRNGEWLGEYIGPEQALGMVGSEQNGVFLHDATSVWGFPGSSRWQADLGASPLGLVLGESSVLAAMSDTCWFLDFGTGELVDTIAAHNCNYIQPVVDASGLLYCLGDSLRVYGTGNRLLGVYPLPVEMPDEMVVSEGDQVYAMGRAGPDKTVVQAFDSTGTRWYWYFGLWASEQGPNTLVTGRDRRVYFATRDTVYALGCSGQPVWAWGCGTGECVSSGTPCLGERGSMFVGVSGDTGGFVVALDSTGNEVWRVGLECRALQGMVLAPDSTIYGVGADDASLFAVYVAEPPAADPCWPVFRHDAGLSGRVGRP